jgi:hypothetical protein
MVPTSLAFAPNCGATLYPWWRCCALGVTALLWVQSPHPLPLIPAGCTPHHPSLPCHRPCCPGKQACCWCRRDKGVNDGPMQRIHELLKRVMTVAPAARFACVIGATGEIMYVHVCVWLCVAADALPGRLPRRPFAAYTCISCVRLQLAACVRMWDWMEFGQLACVDACLWGGVG